MLCIHCDSLDTETDLVGIIATLHNHDTIKDCILVMEIHDAETDSLLLWHGSGDGDILLPGTNHLVNAIRFDPKKFPVEGKNIKTFLWNRQKGTMIVSRIDYYFTRFNTRLVGLYEPL